MQESIINHDNKKVVIIGAGPAGLMAAYELSKSGLESIVLEKDHIVGGISRTINYKNYLFDIGGHRFFTKDKRVEDIWKKVLGDDLLHRKRLSRIYYNKKFFYYPLKPLNALFQLGIWNSASIIMSYLYARICPPVQDDTFECWVSSRFGKRLYRTFFKTYTEKVWGMPCSEISAKWAAQRIRGLSLLVAIKNSFKSQNKNRRNRNIVKTLIDAFYYPRLGPGMMWQAVAEIIKKNGAHVWLGAEVEGIRWNRKRVESLEIRIDGQRSLVQGTHFISSMPLRELIQKFKPAVDGGVLEAANGLKYRDFLTVALIVNKTEVFQDNWIYIHNPDVKLSRIQNFKNWSPDMVPDINKTCLGLEYFCFEGDDLWKMSDQELIELGKREIEALGLIQASDVDGGTVVRMPKSYPVYDSNYEKLLQIVRQFLNGIDNLQLVGRNGMHRYNNQDHSMVTAMLAVENISGANHDLWLVNEEPEYHEEDKTDVYEEVIIRAFSRIDKLAFAAAAGSVCGLIVFMATIWLIIKGGNVIGPNLQLLGQYFVGYSVTVKGAFIGMSHSFIWGFLFGWLFAYLRNIFLALFIYRMKRKVELLSFKTFLDHF